MPNISMEYEIEATTPPAIGRVLLNTVRDVFQLKQEIKKRIEIDFPVVLQEKGLLAVDLSQFVLKCKLSSDTSGQAQVLNNQNELLKEILARYNSPSNTSHIFTVRKNFSTHFKLFVFLTPYDAHRNKRLRMNNTLMDAIIEAKHDQKGIVNGRPNLSLLNAKEKIDVLNCLGDVPSADNNFSTLFNVACKLQNTVTAGGKFPDTISASPQTESLPVVYMPNLYVREAYKKLYDGLIKDFPNQPTIEGQNRLVVTGTSGIGKSVFLVYFTIRLLAESSGNTPPIVIFHTRRQQSKCYVFGGKSCFRSGNIADFEGFLDLPETWYLAESVATPKLFAAKTVISVSTDTLFSESNSYQDVIESPHRKWYMAPWSLVELNECRKQVFSSVTLDLMHDLYARLGGIPRYLLHSASILIARKNSTDHIKDRALERFEDAIKTTRDPALLLQCVAQDNEYLKLSNRLLHRWPSLNPRYYHLKWASNYVKDRIHDALNEKAWSDIFKDRIVKNIKGGTRGLMFEAFVHHLFRQNNGNTFKIRKLEAGVLEETEEDFTIPLNTKVKFIRIPKELSVDPPAQIPAGTGDQNTADLEVLLEDIQDVTDDPSDALEDPEKNYGERLNTMRLQDQADKRLVIPNIPNFAAADFFLLPTTIFQVTVLEDYPIKQAALATIVKSMPAYTDPKAKFRLVFVVPDELYDNYPVQNYVTNDKKISSKIPLVIQKRVEQWVLKINLKNLKV